MSCSLLKPGTWLLPFKSNSLSSPHLALPPTACIGFLLLSWKPFAYLASPRPLTAPLCFCFLSCCKGWGTHRHWVLGLYLSLYISLSPVALKHHLYADSPLVMCPVSDLFLRHHAHLYLLLLNVCLDVQLGPSHGRHCATGGLSMKPTAEHATCPCGTEK